MNDKSVIIALVVLVAILAIAYFAYDKCKLNKYLAPKHQKKCAGGGSFVGAMAQHPHLVPLAFPTSPNWMMNRGVYA